MIEFGTDNNRCKGAGFAGKEGTFTETSYRKIKAALETGNLEMLVEVL